MYIAKAYENDGLVKIQINYKVIVFSFGGCFTFI